MTIRKGQVDAMADAFRTDLKMLEESARQLIRQIKSMPSDAFGNKSEVIAQATLAMRHIEDARMKYGKVLQYNGNELSIYDNPNT